MSKNIINEYLLDNMEYACPYCYHQYYKSPQDIIQDSSYGEKEIECVQCRKIFIVGAKLKVVYYTEKIEK